MKTQAHKKAWIRMFIQLTHKSSKAEKTQTSINSRTDKQTGIIEWNTAQQQKELLTHVTTQVNPQDIGVSQNSFTQESPNFWVHLREVSKQAQLISDEKKSKQ